MGLGAAAQRNVLVHALDLGDEFVGAADGRAYLAGADLGRSRGIAAVV